MKSLIISALFIMLSPLSGKDKLVGKWETKLSPKGNITAVNFKGDNTFEGFVNRKPFVSGTYTLQDDVLSFVDNGCEGKEGVYKLIFFSNDDSLRFEPIMDSCTERRNGMTKTILGRMK